MHRITSFLFGLMILLLPVGALRAQLDPRLQGTSTDFLNLYQQSSSSKVKPEILTIFDFSGSMDNLMFHPLYPNTLTTDDPGGTLSTMSFTFTAATVVSGVNTYEIRAYAQQRDTFYVGWQVTINGSATVKTSTDGGNAGSSYPLNKISETLAVASTPTGTIVSGSSYTFSATVSFSTGSSSKLNKYSTDLNGGLTWKIRPSGSSTWTTIGTTSATPTYTASTWTSNPAESLSWTAPAYDDGTKTAARVTASLNTSSYGTLYSSSLVKPNGTLVTASDAAGADSSSGLSGAGGGSSDVRNWVRAASHVRFQTTVGSDLRTVDIPIAWKIMDQNSTGNPLSSQTVRDRITKTAADGTTTTYGSGLYIDMDTTWKTNSGDDVITGNSTSVSINSNRMEYRKAYLDWLFNGKYTAGSYNGKYIVFDAANASLAGGQDNVNWGQGFGSAATGNHILVPQYTTAGAYSTETMQDASVNIVPAVSRIQAVKRAAIQTWIAYQADVLWAFRYLDNTNERGQNSWTNSSSDYNTGSSWHVLNNTATQGVESTSGNSVTNMLKIANLPPSGSTPLTYAIARGLAQYLDTGNVFNGLGTTPSQCMNHFLILFTDGIDNNGTSEPNSNSATPYLTTTGSTTSFSADAGNQGIIANGSNINTSSSVYWNTFTYAGIAAHLANASLPHYISVPGSYYPSSGTPSDFLPYAIKYRGTGNTTTFDPVHRITTMTFGVSLGGSYLTGSKGSLFKTAVVGDPTLTSCSDISTLTPFVWDSSANEGNGGRKSGSIYFFDATDPAKLVTCLGRAIQSAVGASNINTAVNPNTPYIGAALGQEMYVGKFQPPQNGGAIWGGDLMMFGTRLINNELKIINKVGEATTTLDSTTAQWSTKAAMDAKIWSTRNLYTRVPGGSSLVTFSDQGAGYDAIKLLIAQSGSSASSYAPDSDAQKRVIQFAMGGDTANAAAGVRPTANRSNIMGDIINSSPAAIEYKWSDVTSIGQTVISTDGGNRFRLILVGTNQGWLHAFGEVTWDQVIKDKDGNPKYTIKNGRVAELWAFMPSDFLGNLEQITLSSNPHRFMVDGSPAIYHLDLPPSGGGAPDGLVGSGERAVAIVGLGKGGRSYYALDISNPFVPSLKWSLVPDEASDMVASRIQASTQAPTLDAAKSVVGKMGYSTCTPGIGRITHMDASGKAILRDAVFLGGGFSRPEIEVSTKFGSPLGRSVMALDAYSGSILALQDLSATDANGNPTRGPIYKGVVPFEFFINSGMAQRAYFLDYWGGLWAWGSTAMDTNAASSTYQYRVDSSELSSWNLRQVAQDKNGAALKDASNRATEHYAEAMYTTLPAPFRVGNFPGKAREAGKSVPAVVGIAMESGDRNNPLDQNYAAGTAPTHHRLSVIFDRQDSAAWGTDASPIIIQDQKTQASATGSGSGQVMDAYPGGASFSAADAVISPGNAAYYLAPTASDGSIDTGATKFGYYRKFPDKVSNTTYLPKGINTPAVVSGSLFYSFFTPTAVDVCTGGSGNTYSNLICDVLNPVVAATADSGLACVSGVKYTWYGTASDYIPLGTRGVIQIGTTSVTNADGKVTTSLGAETIAGKTKVQYPKPRVWRTVH